MSARLRRAAARSAVAALSLAPSLVAAQVRPRPTQTPALDRSVMPTAGKTPELIVPRWTTSSLSNGATLVVSERRGLPLIAFAITFIGGTNQFERMGKNGVADFVASTLIEGTTSRSGEELTKALLLLGTNVQTSIAGESGSIRFTAIKDKFEPALAILAEMMLQPAFPEDAIRRHRERTLVTLRQDRDRPSSIANVVFPKVLYSTDHPFGRTRNEASINSITRSDLAAFHAEYFQPGRAVVTVVGDITIDAARAAIERTLGAWPRGGGKPDFVYPAAPAPKATTIYLVDKPGAAQSSISVGTIGPPRNTPDYFALRVMNMVLGDPQLFMSRLNANIREAKGFSYGASSIFSFGRGPGPFRASSEVRTSATDSALVEFIREIKGIRGDRTVADDEITAGKAALIQSLPESFSSVAGVRGMIGQLFVSDLPQDYYQRFTQSVNAVTRDDLLRVARQYLDPDKLAIVIVGDRAKIEAGLQATRIGEIVILDVEGNPLPKRINP
jgi:zinc protease